MGIDVETQHAEKSVLQLAAWAWGKPRIASLLLAFINRIQELEDNLHEIMLARTLAEADMPRLKILGKLVGQPRLGFALEDYRLLIQARGLANVSKGRARDLIAVLELLVGPGQYLLIEAGDATLHLSVLTDITAEQLRMLQQVLPDTRAAGIGFQLLISDDPDAFRWSDPWGDPAVWGSVRVL